MTLGNPSRAAGLLHPVPLVAMAVLGVNDHWGKYAFPGVVTGKVSDFAGLVFFPLLLQAIWEVCGGAVSRRVLTAIAVVTGVVFALVKTWPTATLAYAWALGLLQWPALAMLGRTHLAPVPAVTDPTDLVALPALLVAVWVGRDRDERHGRR